MKVNDIIKRLDKDIFFKILEVLDEDRFVAVLLDGSKKGDVTYIVDKDEVMFVRDEYDDLYNMPPVMVIAHTTRQKLESRYDYLMDHYEDIKETKYPQYGELKFFKEDNSVIVYVVLL